MLLTLMPVLMLKKADYAKDHAGVVGLSSSTSLSAPSLLSVL